MIGTLRLMPESRMARADRRATTTRLRIGGELRMARRTTGLTLAQVGSVIGISRSEASRIERGTAPWANLVTLHRYAAVVGLDLSVRAYPGGEPLRDIGHLRLIDAFRAQVGPTLTVRTEVPIGDPRDLRAWDLRLTDPIGHSCGAEMETRVIDAQDLLRRVTRKAADGGVDRILLVVADTRANRIAVRAAAAMFGGVFAIDDDAARLALSEGRIPPRDALIFVRFGVGVARTGRD